MNAISLIRPYKHHGQWVFDDPRVASADTLIDLATGTSEYSEKTS